MSITNYSELQTAAGRWLGRADLTSILPDLITIAEARLRRELRAKNTLKATIALSGASVALPSDVQEVRTIRLATASQTYPLNIVTQEQLGFLRQSLAAAGAPTHASILNTTTGMTADLYRACDQNYSAELTYYQKLISLSTGAPTNWLITEAPDLYLFATLAEAAPYLQEDERVPMWQAKAEAAIASLNKVAEKAETGAVKSAVNPPYMVF